MADINKALTVLFGQEGGYSDNPNDSGGPTKYGICQRTYPNLDIKNLTIDQAAAIYKRDFWPALYDQITDQTVATKQFSCGVNCGLQTAIKLLQRGLKVAEDGIFGPVTLCAVNSMDPYDLLVQMMNIEKAHYDAIIAANPQDAEFRKSWYTRAEYGVTKKK